MTYGSGPGSGGTPSYGGPPPGRPRRPVLWGAGGALVVLALVLVGMYACQPEPQPPAAAYPTPTSAPPYPPSSTASQMVYPPGSPTVVTDPPPYSTTTPPTSAPPYGDPSATAEEPVPPTRVDAGSGGGAGDADVGRDAGLVVGGLLLAAAALGALAGRRQRTR